MEFMYIVECVGFPVQINKSEIPLPVRTMKEATKCSGREHRKSKNRYQGSLSSWLLAFGEKEMARMLPAGNESERVGMVGGVNCGGGPS
ncbi:hypothetical protein M0802_008944 [Mischocyttarus mexicanus]|nr:hypothetical protein M0802_008944 [Mischocyttarus mexicanus]